MPIKHLILKQNILLTSRAINVVCVCYLNFKANNLKGVQVMGKSTFSVKAALTYSNDHIKLKAAVPIEYTPEKH